METEETVGLVGSIAGAGRGSVGAGMIYNLIARFAFLFGGYVLHIALARILGPIAYGVMGVVLPLVTIARVLVMDGPRQAISKFTAENEDLAGVIRAAALRLEGLLSLGVLVTMLAGAGPLATLLRDPNLAPYIRLVAPMVPFTALMSVYLASLNGLHAFGQQAVATVVYSLGRVALGVVGGWFWGLPGALLGLVLSPLLALATAHILLPANRRGGHFPARRIIHFSIPMIVFAVGDALLMYLDLLFVKAIVSEGTRVGYYTAAATVAQIPYYVLLALADTLLPVTARLLEQGQPERARHTIATGLRYGLMLLVPAATLIATTARPLMAVIYGHAYIPAGPPLAVLIWGQTFYAFSTVLTALLIAEGKPGRAMVLAISLLPISAGLNILLVPRYGLLGAASSTTIATLVGFLASLLLVWRDFGAILYGRPLLAIGGAAGLSGALALWWRPQGALLFPAYLALWAVDILLLWFLGGLDSEDWRRLGALAPRRLRSSL